MKASVLAQNKESIYHKLVNKIDYFCHLSDNWDGEGAIAPDEQVRTNALLLLDWLFEAHGQWIDCLEEVSLHALPHGTIRFAWYVNNIKTLSIEVGATKLSYFVSKTMKEPYQYGSFTKDEIDEYLGSKIKNPLNGKSRQYT